jgi:uracil-DNA glycosylase
LTKILLSSITSFFKAPKGASTESKPDSASSKFDKEAWVAKLTDEQKQLLKLEIDTLHESWLGHLKDELTKPEFLELKRFLKREAESGKTIFPPSGDVYSWCV